MAQDQMTAAVAGTPEATEDVFIFTISSSQRDDEGDVVNQYGWDFSSYTGVVLWRHDQTYPAIGKTLEMWLESEGGVDYLKAAMVFAPPGVNPLADIIRDSVKQGYVIAASVHGFGTRVREISTGLYYEKSLFLEWSIVNIPGNPQALLDFITQE